MKLTTTRNRSVPNTIQIVGVRTTFLTGDSGGWLRRTPRGWRATRRTPAPCTPEPARDGSTGSGRGGPAFGRRFRSSADPGVDEQLDLGPSGGRYRDGHGRGRRRAIRSDHGDDLVRAGLDGQLEPPALVRLDLAGRNSTRRRGANEPPPRAIGARSALHDDGTLWPGHDDASDASFRSPVGARGSVATGGEHTQAEDRGHDVGSGAPIASLLERCSGRAIASLLERCRPPASAWLRRGGSGTARRNPARSRRR